MSPKLRDSLREQTLAFQQSNPSSPNKATNPQDSFGNGGAVSFLNVPGSSAPDLLLHGGHEVCVLFIVISILDSVRPLICALKLV